MKKRFNIGNIMVVQIMFVLQVLGNSFFFGNREIEIFIEVYLIIIII